MVKPIFACDGNNQKEKEGGIFFWYYLYSAYDICASVTLL